MLGQMRGNMAGDAVLLLGSGPVGKAVAPLLARDRGVRSIIVADPQLEQASAAAELCDGKANAVRLDYDDDYALARVLGDVDLAVNTRNLPTDTLLPLIRNVVEAGVSYADATDDPDSLQAVFDSEYLASLAEYRAVGVIPGLGVSPGQTNALAQFLSQRLDQMNEVRLYQLDGIRRGTPERWRQRLASLGSPALVWRGNDWSHVSPMSKWDDVAFPPPWGMARCYVVGVNSVSLPVSVPTLTLLSGYHGFADAEVEETAVDFVRYGLASDHPIDTQDGAVRPAEFAAAFLAGPWSPFAPGAEETHGLPRQLRVQGRLEGRTIHYTMTWVFPEEAEAENIAAPLAVGARMLLGRELPAPGLHPPEALDPAPFLWDMERRGAEIQLTKRVE